MTAECDWMLEEKASKDKGPSNHEQQGRPFRKLFSASISTVRDPMDTTAAFDMFSRLDRSRTELTQGRIPHNMHSG